MGQQTNQQTDDGLRPGAFAFIRVRVESAYNPKARCLITDTHPAEAPPDPDPEPKWWVVTVDPSGKETTLSEHYLVRGCYMVEASRARRIARGEA